MRKAKQKFRIDIGPVFKLEYEAEEEVFGCPDDSGQKPPRFQFLAVVLQVLLVFIKHTRLFGS